MLILSVSSHLDMQHRQAQPLTFVLPLEQVAFSHRHVAPFALVLGLCFRGQACPVLDSVLAVLPRQIVDAFVDLCHLRDLRGVLEQTILDAALRDQAGQHDAGLAVGRVRAVQIPEPVPQERVQLRRECRGPAQFQLRAGAPVILLPEKDDQPVRRKVIAPGLDADVLQVLGQLGEDEGLVRRGRGEGLCLADGLVGALGLGGDRIDAPAVQLVPDLLIGF